MCFRKKKNPHENQQIPPQRPTRKLTAGKHLGTGLGKVLLQRCGGAETYLEASGSNPEEYLTYFLHQDQLRIQDEKCIGLTLFHRKNLLL